VHVKLEHGRVHVKAAAEPPRERMCVGVSCRCASLDHLRTRRKHVSQQRDVFSREDLMPQELLTRDDQVVVGGFWVRVRYSHRFGVVQETQFWLVHIPQQCRLPAISCCHLSECVCV
jgi:hypothetical protein